MPPVPAPPPDDAGTERNQNNGHGDQGEHAEDYPLPTEEGRPLVGWYDAHVRIVEEKGVWYLHVTVHLADGTTAIVPLPWDRWINRLYHTPREAFRVVALRSKEGPYAGQWMSTPPPLPACLAPAGLTPPVAPPPPRLPKGSGTTKPQEPLTGRTPLPDFVRQSEYLMRQIGEL